MLVRPLLAMLAAVTGTVAMFFSWASTGPGSTMSTFDVGAALRSGNVTAQARGGWWILFVIALLLVAGMAAAFWSTTAARVASIACGVFILAIPFAAALRELPAVGSWGIAPWLLGIAGLGLVGSALAPGEGIRSIFLGEPNYSPGVIR